MREFFLKKRFIVATALIIAIAIILFVTAWGSIEYKYTKAVELFSMREYEQANLYFSELRNYKDSADYKERLDAIHNENENAIKVEEVKEEHETTISEKIIYLASNAEMAGVLKELLSTENDDNNAPVFEDGESRPTDIYGNEYDVVELVQKKILVSYAENGYDIFFLGQLNDKGQWDGECLINAYLYGKLQNATVAVYESGIRQRYEQVFFEDDMCIYANRTCVGAKNDGDTWKYNMVSNIEQIISADSPNIEDFIIPSDFRNNISTGMIGRYHGITENGYYEDNTGEAYLISYYSDGTIKTLYKGCFHKGKFEDISGSAWYITSDKEKNVKYMYYKGIFKNGFPTHEKCDTYEAITEVNYSKVKEVVEGYPFEKSLNWDMGYMEK